MHYNIHIKITGYTNIKECAALTFQNMNESGGPTRIMQDPDFQPSSHVLRAISDIKHNYC